MPNGTFHERSSFHDAKRYFIPRPQTRKTIPVPLGGRDRCIRGLYPRTERFQNMMSWGRRILAISSTGVPNFSSFTLSMMSHMEA